MSSPYPVAFSAFSGHGYPCVLCFSSDGISQDFGTPKQRTRRVPSCPGRDLKCSPGPGKSSESNRRLKTEDNKSQGLLVSSAFLESAFVSVISYGRRAVAAFQGTLVFSWVLLHVGSFESLVSSRMSSFACPDCMTPRLWIR